MAFVAVSLSVGTAIGLGTGTAAIIGGGALIGAGVGGLYSAVTGDGNILNSMLTGGLIGGAGAFGSGAFGFGGAGVEAAMAGPTFANFGTLPSTAAVPTSNVLTGTAATNQALINNAINPATGLPFAETSLAGSSAASQEIANAAAQEGLKQTGSGMGMKALGYGLAGTTALSLLGNRQKGPGAGTMPDPGTVRPFDYESTPNQATGAYPAPYATAQYDAAGMPILDTRERNYFSQSFTPMQPYSAKTGTPNPNVPTTAARGGIMQSYQGGGPVERMSMMNTAMNPQGGLYPQGMIDKTQYAMPIQRPVSSELVMDTPGYERSNPMLMAAGGDIDLEEERNKMIMRNIKGASTKELEKTMKALDQQEFLRRNMPAYAESMRPSISSMVEGAQYGDRMAQAYGGQPRDINVIPTTFDPQGGNYGGIAQIGQNIDPQTRVNAMANIQRTPFDRNTLDAVRRVGVGVDRQIGRDANLSAFYEQDPMGRNRMGGARYTQRFEQGGSVKNYSFGGLALIENLMRQAEQNQMPKYQFDQANQSYTNVTPPQAQPSDISRFFSFLSNKQDARPSYSYDSSNQTYQPMAAGGMASLGGYSDGGRMLKGPGDGMSDSIPGVIGGKQPARLADGEFVVPADVVSHLGNGSTDAGAKRLYAMMDKVRKARTGNKKQGKQIKAEKYLPA